MTAVALAGLGCLAAAIAAGAAARAEQARPPTTAERSAAAAAAVAARWRDWPSGRIFPAVLGYSSSVLTREHARRVGISRQHGCAAALTGGAVALASREGCQAVLRASYLDELQGIVYTTGVLAFPAPHQAARFKRAIARDRLPAGVRAFQPAGTGAQRFTGSARQAMTARQAGPYVVVTVAGYADGRPAAASLERRARVFAPAAQLTREILRPLAARPVVDCASPEWSC